MEKMNIKDAIRRRHSVRKYKDIAIDDNLKERLLAEVKRINQDSGLNIQITFNDKDAFTGAFIGYGKLSGVSNYISLIGNKDNSDEEKIGYYGEELVLIAQMLGLNTCWVALTFNKRKTKFTLEKGEKLYCVIALGYGERQGVPHKNKMDDELFSYPENAPSWFIDGINAARLAPTARNQQKFFISYEGDNKVKTIAKFGPYSKMDLGIVKKHFEIGAGKDNLIFV